MIKFFRIIRQKLVQENRVGKYMFYAVGEIFLVIIGILIALNLNKASEANIQEKKIEAILVQIQSELVVTIEDSKNLIETFRQKDSLIYLVMNHKVTAVDYKKPENSALTYLMTYDVLIMQNNGFNNLMLKSEVIPDKYGPLVDGLKNLYIIHKEFVEFSNKKLEDLWDDSFNYLRTNHGWMALYYYLGGALPDEALDYYLNDVDYRFDLMKTSNQGRLFLDALTDIRADAITYIRDIDVLLEADNTYAFDYDVSDYVTWIGKYHFEGDTIQIESDEAGLKRSLNNGEWRKIYPLSKTKFHHASPWYYVFHKDEQGEIIGYTASQENTRHFWEKIKAK